MESLLRPNLTLVLRNYFALTKPGIIFGNAITFAGGFALASKGHLNPLLFLATLVGLSSIIASACVFNNYIDRELDAKMVRTKNRPLVKGLISIRNAVIFAVCLLFYGSFLLAAYVNLLTLTVALFGFFVYVILYSLSKYHSGHGTLIGSIAGAVPPVVGYCALTNYLDSAAFILFIIIAMWQMPHFFSIAIYRLDDYVAASIPVLPIKKGMLATKIHMMLYIIAFIVASVMLTVCNYTGYIYLTVAALSGATWLWICIKGFTCDNDKLWARKMFFVSLVIVMSVCISIPFSVV